jgi:hypothetical protein
MGQYYKAVNVDDMEHVSPHDYDNGAKLMEHSYIGNNFVEAVEFLLIDTGENKNRWSGKRIVWAGDYADDEPMKGNNLYSLVDKPLYMLIEAVPPSYKYLVNLDKKEFVDKTKCTLMTAEWNTSKLVIHPLPLLTVDGNGRGGGDYHEEDEPTYVGRWTRDRISLVQDKPEDFVEITTNFDE